MSATPNDPPNFESDGYFIVSNKMLCLNCESLTNVYGFALPDRTMPYFIRHVSRNAAEQMEKLTDSYWFDTDPDTNKSFWMNHCQGCAAQIREEDIFEESQSGEGPFGPEPYEGDEALEAHRFNGPFQAWADAELKDWASEPDAEDDES